MRRFNQYNPIHDDLRTANPARDVVESGLTRALKTANDGSRPYVNLGLAIDSRNLRDVTSQFPELATLSDHLSTDSVVFDGELVCLDDNCRPEL